MEGCSHGTVSAKQRERRRIEGGRRIQLASPLSLRTSPRYDSHSEASPGPWGNHMPRTRWARRTCALSYDVKRGICTRQRARRSRRSSHPLFWLVDRPHSFRSVRWFRTFESQHKSVLPCLHTSSSLPPQQIHSTEPDLFYLLSSRSRALLLTQLLALAFDPSHRSSGLPPHVGTELSSSLSVTALPDTSQHYVRCQSSGTRSPFEHLFPSPS